MSKKRVYQKKSFESTGSNSDTSANVYLSMMMSPAWKDLTPRQKVLYYYAKSRLYGQKTAEKQSLFKQYPDFKAPSNVDIFFSLSIGNVTKDAELYSETNLQAFYRDLESLILHGFIRCVACGNIARVKTIYTYSDKWQIWNTPTFKIEPNEMTSAMRKKYLTTICCE